MAHLDEHKLLSDKQHAFRKWHSCETQLKMVLNDWAKILDNIGEVRIFILEYWTSKKLLIHPHMNSLKVNCLATESVIKH